MKLLAVSQNRADPSAHLAGEAARMAEHISAGIVQQAS